jgi:hypothetical protein
MPEAKKRFLGTIFLGQGSSDSLPPQGYGRACEILREVFNTPSVGLFGLLRLLIALAAFVFPTALIDQVVECTLGNPKSQSRSVAFVAVPREIYYAARFVFLASVLLTEHRSWIAVGFVIYFVLDILHNLAGGVFVWGRYSIYPSRSLLFSAVNYFEVTIAFAIFYLYWDCLDVKPLYPTQALYFSLVTATTVGFGDIKPANLVGQTIVITQLSVFVFIVLFVLTTFVSRVRQETRTVANNQTISTGDTDTPKQNPV